MFSLDCQTANKIPECIAVENPTGPLQELPERTSHSFAMPDPVAAEASPLNRALVVVLVQPGFNCWQVRGTELHFWV